MRDYNLMRNMLVFIGCSDRELNLVDFQHFGDVSPVRSELSRLREEGLVESNMAFKPSYNNGTVFWSGVNLTGNQTGTKKPRTCGAEIGLKHF